jgi:hypothetical protein
LFPKTDLGKRAPGKKPYEWYGGHLGSICGLWARVKHFYCAQKPRNRSSGEAKTQKPTKSTVALKRRIFKDTLYVFKDACYDMFDGLSQQRDIASCTAEVCPPSSFWKLRTSQKRGGPWHPPSLGLVVRGLGPGLR